MKKIFLILLLLAYGTVFSQDWKNQWNQWNIWNVPNRTVTIISDSAYFYSIYPNEPDSVKGFVMTWMRMIKDSLNITKLSDFYLFYMKGLGTEVIKDWTQQQNPYKVGTYDYVPYKGWYHIDTSVHGYIHTGLTTMSWIPGSISHGSTIHQNYSSNKCYDYGAVYGPDQKIFGMGNATGIIYQANMGEHTAKVSTWVFNNPTTPLLIVNTRTTGNEGGDSMLINGGSDINILDTYYEQHPCDTPRIAYDIPIGCYNQTYAFPGTPYIYFTYRKLGTVWFGKRGVSMLEARKISNCEEWLNLKLRVPVYQQNIRDTTFHGYDSSAWNYFVKASVPDADRDTLNMRIKGLKDSLGIGTLATKFSAVLIFDRRTDSIPTKFDLTTNNNNFTTEGMTWYKYSGWGAITGYGNTNVNLYTAHKPYWYIRGGWGYGVSSATTNNFNAGLDLNGGNGCYIAGRFTDGKCYMSSPTGTYWSGVTVADCRGAFYMSWETVNDWYGYQNGVEILHNTTTRGAFYPADLNVYLGMQNGGTTKTSRIYSHYWIGAVGVAFSPEETRKIYNCLK